MTPTMREKLARAVAEWANGEFGDGVGDWSRLPDGKARFFEDGLWRGDCYEIVDAILNVLREPDEAMVEAGFPAWRESEGASDDELGRAALRVWQAMLDTITNEGRG